MSTSDDISYENSAEAAGLTAGEQRFVEDRIREVQLLRKVESDEQKVAADVQEKAMKDEEESRIKSTLLADSEERLEKVAEYRALLEKLEELQKLGEDIVPYQLEKQFHIDHTVIKRIIQGNHHAHLDGGGAGRRPDLTMRGEALLGIIVNILYRHYGIAVTGKEFKNICLEIWRVENHGRGLEREPPSFDSHFRRRWAERFPQFDISAQSAAPMDVRRLAVSSEHDVYWALNSLKSKLHKQAPMSSGGWIPASRIVCCDEIDLSGNNESGGIRHLVPHGCRTYAHSLSPNRHITAVIFTSLSGVVLANPFVVSGPANVSPMVSYETLFPQNGTIIFDSSGSVEKSSCGKDGSWLKVLRDFVDRTDDRYGVFAEVTTESEISANVPGDKHTTEPIDLDSTPTSTKKKKSRNYKIFLVVDGCAAHKDDSATEFLEKHGYILIVLEPNLTHLIQLNDTEELNGRLKGKLRADLDARAERKEQPMLETALAELEQIIIGSFNASAIRRAAKAVGFVISDDTLKVRIDDEGIHEAVDSMILKGRIRAEGIPPSKTRFGMVADQITEMLEHPEELHTFPLKSDVREGLTEGLISGQIIRAHALAQHVTQKRQKRIPATSLQESDVKAGTIEVSQEQAVVVAEAARRRSKTSTRKKRGRKTRPKATTHAYAADHPEPPAEAVNGEPQANACLFLDLFPPLSL